MSIFNFCIRIHLSILIYHAFSCLSTRKGVIEKFHVPFVSLHSALQQSTLLHQLMIDEENAGFQIGQYLGGQDGG